MSILRSEEEFLMYDRNSTVPQLISYEEHVLQTQNFTELSSSHIKMWLTFLDAKIKNQSSLYLPVLENLSLFRMLHFQNCNLKLLFSKQFVHIRISKAKQLRRMRHSAGAKRGGATVWTRIDFTESDEFWVISSTIRVNHIYASNHEFEVEFEFGVYPDFLIFNASFNSAVSKGPQVRVVLKTAHTIQHRAEHVSTCFIDDEWFRCSCKPTTMVT